MLIQPRIPKAQEGIIMLITLTALMIMTLASVALMRSSDVTQVISGNLAFRQTVMQSAEMGIEAAVEWLELVAAAQSTSSQQSGGSGTVTVGANGVSSLESNALGYSAVNQEPTSSQTWDEFWNSILSTQSVNLPEDTSTGNQVSYAIQRLCDRPGSPDAIIDGATVSCQHPPDSDAPLNAGNSETASGKNSGFKVSTNPVYYRITVKITGPRNSMSYVQSIIAM